MRIVIIQDYLRMGGTERQSLFVCEELLKCHHDAHLILFRSGGILWKNLISAKIPYTVLQKHDTGLCFYAPGLMKIVEDLRPDVILCMGRTANCYAGFLQRRFPDAKVVSTLRTGKVVFPLHYWSLDKVSAVLVNSNWWKRRMLERGFPSEFVRVIHNPMMLKAGADDKTKWRHTIRSRTAANKHTCVFLDVAALRSGKRHIELLESFRLFAATTKTDWQLWLVGSGRELETCRRFVKKNGLGERVFFFGQQPKTGPFYAGADAAVSASREDSLPNFLIEAQAMGLPLVAVECRGVDECCIPDKTGLIIPPDRSDIFAEALEKIATTTQMRETASKLAPAFAREHFGAARQAALTIAFLEGLAKKGCAALQ